MCVNPGLAFGKVYIIDEYGKEITDYVSSDDEWAVLEKAVLECSNQLDELIRSTCVRYGQTISTIFEAHKLMLSDPAILQMAAEWIQSGMNAYAAYQRAARTVIDQFESHVNEYMRNRVMDIKDATDRVLYYLAKQRYDMCVSFDESRIIFVKEMRPSMMCLLEKDSIKGLVSESGAYNQHAGIILRIKDIPTMIVPDIMGEVQNNDSVLVDGNRSVIYLNPDERLVNNILKERR